MAVAFQGFSIREYAAKMRTVDLGKCWPFGIDPADEMKKEDIKLLLPPITVTKFRWWSHELHGGRKHDQIHGGNANVRGEEVELRRNGSELDAERAEFKKSQVEDEKLEMVCPVCLIFTAATVNAVNAHMDSCLAQPSKKEARRQMKAKSSKAPKKRSIAEIFAVAPQIEALDVDDESGDEDSSGGGEMFGSCKFSSRDNVVSIIKGKKININKRMKLKKKKKKKRALEESGMAIVSKLKKNKKFKKAAVKNGSISKKAYISIILNLLESCIPIGVAYWMAIMLVPGSCYVAAINMLFNYLSFQASCVLLLAIFLLKNPGSPYVGTF